MTQFIYPILYFVQIASVVEKIEDIKILVGNCQKRSHQVVRQEVQVLVEGRLVQVMKIVVSGPEDGAVQKHKRQLRRYMQEERVM